MAEIRSMIADDHPQITSGLSFALESYGILQVAAVNDGALVVSTYLKIRPDVLVLDLRMGAVGGLDVARELLAIDPTAKIVFYSQFDQDHIVQEAYKIGGKGFVTKNRATSILVDAIKTVHSGETFFLPEIASRLEKISSINRRSPAEVLSEREFAVFKHMALGLTNPEIAAALGLSESTVMMMANSVKTALGVTRLPELKQLAIQHNVLQQTPGGAAT